MLRIVFKTTFITFVISSILSACHNLDFLKKVYILTKDPIIVTTNVTAYGNIIDIGNNGLIDHGFCWSLNQNPTISDNVISLQNTNKTGEYFANLLNLLPGKIYYVRAFAKSEDDLVYGENKSFVAPDAGILIANDSVRILNTSSGQVYGHISNLGSLMICDYGHCWSTDSFPTLSSGKTSFASLNHDTAFTSILTNLKLSLYYYIRSYFKLDETRIYYSKRIDLYLPDLIVETDTSVFNAGSAILQGNIVDLGIPPVTNHGFCWSTTTSNPDYNQNRINKGSNTKTGIFTASISSIDTGVSYYYRAYATDGNTVKYGKIKHFKF